MIRVLVIDNEQEILDMLTLILSTEPDFETRTLPDSLRWREAIEEFRPDVILVDYRMPAMSGDLLIQALTVSGLRSTVHGVALFSATPLTAAEVQRIGADKFFEKPFDIQQLVSGIRSLAKLPLPSDMDERRLQGGA